MIFILHFARAAGSLIGLAIGDAIGAPFEGRPPSQIFIKNIFSGGIHSMALGEVTDDTEQAMAIARSLVFCRGFSPPDIMRRLIAGYFSKPHVYGPTSSLVFELVARGVSPVAAAYHVHTLKGGSRSNGSVMRGAPLGIFYSPHVVREISLECSELTHYDPVAGECSAFVNRMISELVRGKERHTSYGNALSDCQSQEVRDVLGNLPASPLNPSLDALDATHCAVAIFLNSCSFRDAITRAVNLGGDTDTISAICGSLSGSYFGYGAIPRRWLDTLRVHDALLLLTKDLYLVAEK